MKKECPKYYILNVKKCNFLTLVCFVVNLTFIAKDTL